MEQANQKKSHQQRNHYLLIFAIAILTAIASEVKVIPYEGAPFRFGLGTVIFLLSILIRPLPLIPAGMITGMVVVLFRTFLNVLLFGDSFLSSVIEHVPASLFYISFAFFLMVIRKKAKDI